MCLNAVHCRDNPYLSLSLLRTVVMVGNTDGYRLWCCQIIGQNFAVEQVAVGAPNRSMGMERKVINDHEVISAATKDIYINKQN